jgi:hypothetical protein
MPKIAILENQSTTIKQNCDHAWLRVDLTKNPWALTSMAYLEWVEKCTIFAAFIVG